MAPIKSMSVNADESLIDSFDALCKKVGLNRTSAINVFMTQAVREQRIPFEITAAESASVRSYEQYALSDIEEGIAHLKAGRTLGRTEALAMLKKMRAGRNA